MTIPFAHVHDSKKSVPSESKKSVPSDNKKLLLDGGKGVTALSKL